ncbi:MAG: hypothetical protein RM368_13145 [Nostoc sp. DedSLP03]|uniref:hypothetical protein n=1 Tax=Nostoc sp. DedSLP03 TaxID=3075400 RepID=UPI002AD40B31|nr:hypothetical protein [Nostoc sp. DedSLP03]MDZ7965902.1 hypothetical protein [Nostoc sp. DedSLP03]
MINLGLGSIAHNLTAVFQAFWPNTLKLTDRSERKGAIATISARKLEEWEQGSRGAEETRETRETRGQGDKQNF